MPKKFSGEWYGLYSTHVYKKQAQGVAKDLRLNDWKARVVKEELTSGNRKTHWSVYRRRI